MKLTDGIITCLKGTGKARKVADGGGLHIYLSPSGGKHWRMSYRFEGRQKLLSFGAYPAVSIEDARAKRSEAKRLLANGIDPSDVKRGIRGGNRFAAEIQFMRDKIAEVAQLAVKNKLCLEISIGVRMPEGQNAVTEIQPIGAFVLNPSTGE
ncbi:Arm DNA-binding domain-containing protein [Desulfovibrio sp. OttesenSCG-928-G15]|nr:Arm DNA-binding domain-containing protein [Desulfovibrio sp. OttesenSCG-928-G15]